MSTWPLRRWVAAALVALATVVVIGVPTVLVPTPWFGREVDVTWWSWPVLLATAALSGLLAATYVRADADTLERAATGTGTGTPVTGTPAIGTPVIATSGTGTHGVAEDVDTTATTSGRLGVAGGLLAYFAVGCPVCNKVALLALGYTGALQWFAPLQPVLALVAVVLLAWALRRRLAGERACPVALPEPARLGVGRPTSNEER